MLGWAWDECFVPNSCNLCSSKRWIFLSNYEFNRMLLLLYYLWGIIIVLWIALFSNHASFKSMLFSFFSSFLLLRKVFVKLFEWTEAQIQIKIYCWRRAIWRDIWSRQYYEPIRGLQITCCKWARVLVFVNVHIDFFRRKFFIMNINIFNMSNAIWRS